MGRCLDRVVILFAMAQSLDVLKGMCRHKAMFADSLFAFSSMQNFMASFNAWKNRMGDTDLGVLRQGMCSYHVYVFGVSWKWSHKYCHI